MWRSVGGHNWWLDFQPIKSCLANRFFFHVLPLKTFFSYFSFQWSVFLSSCAHTLLWLEHTLTNKWRFQMSAHHGNRSHTETQAVCVSRQELCKNKGMECVASKCLFTKEMILGSSNSLEVDECVRCGGRNACVWMHIRVKESKNKEKKDKKRNRTFGTRAATLWKCSQIGLNGWNICELSAQKLSLLTADCWYSC